MKSTKLGLSGMGLAVGVATLLGPAANADFLGIVAVDDPYALDGITPLTELEGYAGERVINVYAQFDDPLDQAVFVGGLPEGPFQVRTLGGTGFVNSAKVSGNTPPSQGEAIAIPSANYDSFYTIGLKIGLGALVIAPGTPGPNTDPWPAQPHTNMGWTVPPVLEGEPTPQTLAGKTGRVLLMRLVVQPGEDIEGGFYLIAIEGGDAVAYQPAFDSLAPGACCTPDQVCQEELTAESCAALGGNFLGSGSVCTPFGCTGACCFDAEPGRKDCAVVNEPDCETLPGGIFLGVATPCPESSIFTVVHEGDQWSHEIVTFSLCPNAGVAPCVSGPAFVDTWVTMEAASVNCENFGHPSACPVPAGFFGPGSDPYDGVVCFEGAALGEVLLEGFDEAVDFGDADTLVRRAADPFDRCELPGGGARSVDIVVERLNLVGIEPITVTFNGGQSPEAWDVRVEVNGTAGQPGGELIATKSHCNGGTFQSTLSVCPTFVFTRVSDGLEMSLDYCGTCNPAGIVMDAEDVAWVHDLEPGLGVVSPVCSTFHPGVEEGTKIVDCDCNGNGLRDRCDLEAFTSRDCEGDGIPDECGELFCQADATCDTIVNVDDALLVVDLWGCANPPGPCPADVDFDGDVDVDDLIFVVLSWGPCP